MERTVFYVLVVFLFLVPSSLQDTETNEKVEDPCPELKRLWELLYQQAGSLSELKLKMEYMQQQNTGEMKNITSLH